MKRAWEHATIITFLTLAIILLLYDSANSINFQIKPVRIFLDAKVKTEKIIIKNLSNEELSLQLKTYKWSQNPKGEDVYEETADIIVFPKIFTMKKGEERIIRIGTNLQPGMDEQLYRLYIEELPITNASPEGAAIHILTKAGVPIFINPVKAVAKGKIESIIVKKGVIEAAIKNNGNLHFIINSIKIKGQNIKGKDVFTKDISGWYLLSGAKRLYTTPIPQKICKDIVKLHIEVNTDKFNLDGKLDVNKATCLP